jgi:hypothetical protein
VKRYVWYSVRSWNISCAHAQTRDIAERSCERIAIVVNGGEGGDDQKKTICQGYRGEGNTMNVYCLRKWWG